MTLLSELYKPVILGCTFIWLGAAELRAEVLVPVATDLHADGETARTSRLPILLAFLARYCSYCEELEEGYLKPMLRSGEYAERILIRKLILDNGSHLTDFNGEKISATALATRYRVYVTPTILFVDAAGEELAGRMVGFNTPEMYGGYLDQCIETARHIIRGTGEAADLNTCRLMEQEL
jgi:thioredoxin-related protein